MAATANQAIGRADGVVFRSSVDGGPSLSVCFFFSIFFQSSPEKHISGMACRLPFSFQFPSFFFFHRRSFYTSAVRADGVVFRSSVDGGPSLSVCFFFSIFFQSSPEKHISGMACRLPFSFQFPSFFSLRPFFFLSTPPFFLHKRSSVLIKFQSKSVREAHFRSGLSAPVLLLFYFSFLIQPTRIAPFSFQQKAVARE